MEHCISGKMAYELAGEELPEPWKELAEKRIHSCHFEFPGIYAFHADSGGQRDG